MRYLSGYVFFSVLGVSQIEPKTNLKLTLKRVNPVSYRIENSSDEDPFSGEDGDEYIPAPEASSSSSSDSDAESGNHASENVNTNSNANADNSPLKKKARKRQRKPEEWGKEQKKKVEKFW